MVCGLGGGIVECRQAPIAASRRIPTAEEFPKCTPRPRNRCALSRLGVNLVNIGAKVVMAVCSPTLEQNLNHVGIGGARKLFWAGYGQRSRREAYTHVASFFDRKVVPLELVDARYYHVDTCLAVLNSGHIVYYPPAFSADSIERLRTEVGDDQWLIAAGEGDASRLGVNLVNIGTKVVMAVCSPTLEQNLNHAGFQVIRSPLPAFGLSGGAAVCLTLRLH